MEELYKMYGQLMVQRELLDNRLNQIRREIDAKLRATVPTEVNAAPEDTGEPTNKSD